MLDTAAARAAYRALPWQHRWQLRRNTGFARVATDPHDAAIMVWWARRQLIRSPWAVPLGVYAIAVLWGLPGPSGRVGATVFAGVIWGYLFGVASTRRLRDAISVNATRAGTDETQASAGLPSDLLIYALTAAAVAAAVATILVVR